MSYVPGPHGGVRREYEFGEGKRLRGLFKNPISGKQYIQVVPGPRPEKTFVYYLTKREIQIMNNILQPIAARKYQVERYTRISRRPYYY